MHKYKIFTKQGDYMWLDKRYHSLDYELKNIFAHKVIKLSIDGGFTCPTRDGSKATNGCIFCSSTGSGEHASSRCLSIKDQLKDQIELLSPKWPDAKYIAYFQNFTNTYADIKVLREKYNEALAFDGIIGIAIATRADCLDDKVVNLLDELNKRTYLWVEIGLQTTNALSEVFIRRGYDLQAFNLAIDRLHDKDIKTVAHVIINLPNETTSDYLSTINHLIDKKIWGIKIHMLHILKYTDLEIFYKDHPFDIMDADSYIHLICDLIAILPQDMVVHRLTGDPPKDLLIEPLWTKNKRYILNGITKELNLRNIIQGQYYDSKNHR